MDHREGVTRLMWVRVLGSAAGGGFPQWNCGCANCRAIRDGSRPGRPRTQSSIVVSADYRRWFLFNASPDLRAQIEAFPPLHPNGPRSSPIEAVLLTDAEIDHTLGLLFMRESGTVEVHATRAVHEVLWAGTGVARTLASYCELDRRPVVENATVPLGDGMSYQAFAVPTTKRQRFGAAEDRGRVVGYRITDERSGRAVVYLPAVQELTPAVRENLEGCACLLVDGTCFRDDELIWLGVGGRSAREMGHLPVSGADGSLKQLSSLPVGRTVYVHINNTNPMLLDDAPERQVVEEYGMEVAEDGLEVEV